MKKRILCLLGLASMLSFNQHGHAAGFFLIEQSVSSMGNAHAGGAAVAEDPSTVFFNPAGMTRLCGFQTLSGAHIVIPVANYDDDDSRNIVGTPLTGGDGRDAGEAALVGHFYATKSWNNCLAFGLGINSPFGLATDYKDSWKGRYYAIRSQLLTININPSVAYKINRCWSIGAGFDVMYLHAKLSNAVDFGLILTPTTGALSQQLDGKVFLKGNSWGYGGNIGVLYEPTCRTRFGVHFRSEIKHRIKGSERFEDVPAQLQAVFQDTRAKSDVTLPSSLSFSGYHEFNDCWAVMADATWFKWDTVKRLRFRFNNEAQPDGITTLRWKNTWRYSIGTSFKPNRCWTYRAGLAYDETPTPNKELRTPRVPDEDRFWTAFGIGYQWNPCLQFDFAYAHVFARTPRIDKSGFELEEDNTRGGLEGKWDDVYTDIISFQFIWRF